MAKFSVVLHTCFSLNCVIMEIISDLNHRHEQHIEFIVYNKNNVNCGMIKG